MNIHEYQAKQIFQKYGVPTPKGIMVESVDAAVEAAKELGGPIWVVKAQIHAGGRGLGGGVKLAKSLDEVREVKYDDPYTSANGLAICFIEKKIK